MKIFANKKFRRFICILVVVIMLFNVVAPKGIILEAEAAGVGAVVAGLGGIIMYPLACLLGGIAFVFQAIMNGILWLSADIASAGGDVQGEFFISDIVYNKLDLINANIFDEDANPLFKSGDGLTSVVSKWYQITRMMALAATLVVLVYVAIQILISSTGQSKAKYMELLKDWLLCLLLIFTMHYILAAILYISDAIVAFLASSLGDAAFTYGALIEKTFFFNTWSIIYALIWIALMVFTFVMFIMYVKRLILICFFVVISPLVVILSTIDKLRGKGGGLLSNMLKEFVANVAMQPLDAILFTIVMSSIVICMDNDQPLVAVAFVIAFFMLRKWVQKFLGQESSQIDQGKSAGMVVNGVGSVISGAGALSGKMSNLGKGGGKNKALASNIVRNSKNPSSPSVPKVSAPHSGAGPKGSKTPAPTSGAKKLNLSGRASHLGNTDFDSMQSAFMNSSDENFGGENKTSRGLHLGNGSFDSTQSIFMNSSDAESTLSGGSVSLGSGSGGGTSSSSGASSSSGRVKKALPIAARALKKTASFTAGIAGGTAMAASNLAAGKSMSDGFSKGYGTASGLADNTLGAAGRGVEYVADNGIGGTFETVKDGVAGKINGSYIVAGEDGQKRIAKEKEDIEAMTKILDDEESMEIIREAYTNELAEEERQYFSAMNEAEQNERALNFARMEGRKHTSVKGKGESYYVRSVLRNEKKKNNRHNGK